jgi:hypothetical protein
MKIIKPISLAVAIMASQHAAAGIISDYTLDTNTNIVTDSASGIEWLQWTETDGLSIDAALAAHAAAGWAIATNTQMAYLFNSFDLAYGTFSWSDGETAQHDYSPPDGPIEAPGDRELVFVSLFGDTYTEWETSACPGHDCLQYASAAFGSDVDGDALYQVATAYDDYEDGISWMKQRHAGIATFSYDDYTRTVADESRGVALTRSATQFNAVPEPSTLALFALALMGMGARRYRKS